MKTLLLLRHAKSSWDDGVLADHDRPLNDRGKRDAPDVGRHLTAARLSPDYIVSSTAKRARSTAKRVATECGYEDDIELRDDLYAAAPLTIVEVLRALNDLHLRVLLVGHNPGLEELAELLTGSAVSMPTAALAHISLDIATWSELTPGGQGRLVAHWCPRDEH